MTLLGLAVLLDEVFKRKQRAGRKSFQKLLYFAQFFGWPTHFRFKLGNSGPFSADAAGALEVLASHGAVVTNNGTMERGPLLEGLVQDAPIQVDAAVTKQLDALIKLDDNDLELLATVHFIVESDRRANLEVRRDRVIDEVADYEGARFDRRQIEDTVRRLDKLALLPT